MATMTTTTRNRLAAGWLAGWGLLAAVFLLALLPASKNLPGLSGIGSLAYSTKNIEEIEPGDYVLAREEFGDTLGGRAVVQVFAGTSDHVRLLRIEDAAGGSQELRTTDGHPFWTIEAGWVLARDLTCGQRLLQSDGRHARLVATSREEHPDGIAIYNFEVDDWHTYYVAGEGDGLALLAHNRSVHHNHHVFPCDFIDEFMAAGIDPDNYCVAGVPNTVHHRNPLTGSHWNPEWGGYLSKGPKSRDAIMAKGRRMANKYGVPWTFCPCTSPCSSRK